MGSGQKWHEYFCLVSCWEWLLYLVRSKWKHGKDACWREGIFARKDTNTTFLRKKEHLVLSIQTLC